MDSIISIGIFAGIVTMIAQILLYKKRKKDINNKTIQEIKNETEKHILQMRALGKSEKYIQDVLRKQEETIKKVASH